jgi:hypothetical protein
MRNATTREDLPIMLADVLEGTICSRLLGRFLPIAASDAEGSIPGTAPADGRWWIRGCEAHRLNNLLTLALSGTGWNWVDQEGHGYRVRQYVLFRASATLLGLWDVHYDPVLAST